MSAKKPNSKRANELVKAAFGTESLEELHVSQIPPFDDFSPKHAARIIDGDCEGTNIAQMVELWRSQDTHLTHAGGRPAFVSLRSVLILKFMHAIARKPMTIKQLAETVSFALSPEQMNLIGLVDDGADTDSWYQRIDSANRALLRLVDPYRFPTHRRNDPDRPAVADRITRQRILKGPQRQELDRHWRDEAERNKIRQERLDDLTFEINANIIRSVRSLVGRFSGDIALDATYTKVDGHHSPKDLSMDARCVTIEAGLWMRGGNHGVDDATAKKRKHSKFKFGFEMDIVTMTLGPDDDAPELILAMNLHRPGKVTHVARTLFPRIQKLGLPGGTIAVDRLYNDGLDVADFHLPLLQHGYEFVFDYKGNQLGPKASHSHNGVDYILVDGTWHLAAMPDDLAFAAFNHRLPIDHENYIDAETLARQVAARKPYQLKRHGARQSDGYQRYSLPDPAGYPPIIDFDTGEVLPKPTNKTVTIPGSVGLRWEQKFAYLSPEWRTAYNLRSAVERKNAQLKQGTTTDLDNADNRPQRSFAANALSVALLVSAHNLVISQEYITKLAGKDNSKGRSKRAGKRDSTLKLHSIAKQKDGRTRRSAAA